MASNLDPNLDQSRRKRRKLEHTTSIQNNHTETTDHTRWKTESEHQIYSSSLFQALRNNNHSGTRVRELADRVLAIRARGRTRWSRAIITNRIRAMKKRINGRHKRARARAKKVSVTGDGGSRLRRKEGGGVEEKVSLLGKLVPGCRKLPLPKFLEETADYIAALEMQVRAMTALAEILTGDGGGVNYSASISR